MDDHDVIVVEDLGPEDMVLNDIGKPLITVDVYR